MEIHLTNVGASIENLEIQISQLANALTNQQRGAFPSNTEVNPIEQCKAITLRSEKEFGVNDPKVVDDEDRVEEIEVELKKSASKNSSNPVVVSEKIPVPKSILPYPQRFKKKALDEQYSKFLDIFKKIRINIPFVDALNKMPQYENFMKDVMSRKRKLKEFEMVKLTEEYNAILQKKLPQKLKDPGSFTIPCIIGGVTVNRELCDLGARIELKSGRDPKVAKKVKKKVKSKMIFEYVWRVKERNKTSNKVTGIG
ncbi:uncharacterized protein [Henckelia pumila]|uniref:uncharacterized protein n=1 Tax=Henckelia pumila TaxID=405737 RepID=UPI003C6DFA01